MTCAFLKRALVLQVREGSGVRAQGIGKELAELEHKGPRLKSCWEIHIQSTDYHLTATVSTCTCPELHLIFKGCLAYILCVICDLFHNDLLHPQ